MINYYARLSIKILTLIFSALPFILCGCGIYTIEEALRPPFDLHMSDIKLYLSGYNTEEYFSGYVIWYKEIDDTFYYNCIYKDINAYPTIPRLENMEAGWVEYYDYTSDVDNPRIEYVIEIENLKPISPDKTFIELKGEGKKFYFAVSAYGENGAESGKAEFGRWPD